MSQSQSQRLFKKRLIGDIDTDADTNAGAVNLNAATHSVIDDVVLYGEEPVQIFVSNQATDAVAAPAVVLAVPTEQPAKQPAKKKPAFEKRVKDLVQAMPELRVQVTKKTDLLKPKGSQISAKTQNSTQASKQPKKTGAVKKKVQSKSSAIANSTRQSSTSGKIALFIQLAKPNEKGVSRWVQRDEWIGTYAPLALGNGLSWGRKGSKLDEMYVIEKDRSQTNGNSIDAIRLNGLRK